MVACGVGRDSIAMLIRMKQKGIVPDAIVFADTHSEKWATYAYIPVLQRWLKANGFPPLTIVSYRPATAPYFSLEGNMILNATLPGVVFGKGSCSIKFKIEPQNRWARSWRPAQEAWARGEKVIKLIGFEADEEYRLKRADAKAHLGDGRDRELYEYRMPLMDWGLNLEKCLEIIDGAGLPIPVKSACFFCPNMKPWEVDQLAPEDRARIILMELAAEPYNKSVEGLWRRERKADGRPGSITKYILEQGLEFTPLEELALGGIVLNPECKKARTGTTFNAPHIQPSLATLLRAAGHYVPEVLLDSGALGFIYQESVRSAEESMMNFETDQHMELIQIV